jgi:hypothetical protein
MQSKTNTHGNEARRHADRKTMTCIIACMPKQHVEPRKVNAQIPAMNYPKKSLLYNTCPSLVRHEAAEAKYDSKQQRLPKFSG